MYCTTDYGGITLVINGCLDCPLNDFKEKCIVLNQSTDIELPGTHCLPNCPLIYDKYEVRLKLHTFTMYGVIDKLVDKVENEES